MPWTTSIYALDDDVILDRWRALWTVSPQRSPFASLPYVRATAQAFDLQGEMHLVTSGDRAEAGVLVFWRQRGPYREVVIPPFTQYTPWVMRTQPSEADVHRHRSPMTALLTSLEARFHVLRFFCFAITDLRPAQWRRWQATPRYTYRLQLNDEDDVVTHWSSSTRRTFRNARDDYHVAEDPEAADAVVRLCAESYGRHDRSLPASPQRLVRLIDALHRSDMVRIFTATRVDDTAPEGGFVVLHDDQMAHYWIAGSRPGAAMTVLIGEVLPQLRADGIETFDFVGANTPSIAEFKRSFGPTLTPYLHLENITRPELRLLKCLKSALSPR